MIFDLLPKEAGLVLAALEHTQKTAEDNARNGVDGASAQAARCVALSQKIQQQAYGAVLANELPANEVPA